jgi:signal transduction histidine kinase
MKLKSMRVRLPLTYAAIALLTAFALGGVLILTLQDYYTQRERLYLTDRAVAIQAILSKMIDAGLPPKALEAQVRSLAFFTQARIRLFDNEQNVLADSGDPNQGDVFSVLPLTTSVDLKGGSIKVIQSLAGPPQDGPGTASIGGQTEALPVPEVPPKLLQEFNTPMGIFEKNGVNTLFFFRSVQSGDVAGMTAPLTDTVVMLSAVPKSVAYSSYDLIAEGQDTNQRSSQVVRLAVQDSSGNLAGILELSESQAYGGVILKSVTRASLAAGLVAVLLAAFVGWLVSRQVTRPLTALTQVTRQMATGQLSARANVLARDEFGALGESFNHMADRIEEIVGALRNFVGDAAHELQTPLTALQTNLELAGSETASPNQRAYLGRARQQVRRLSHLTENLLDLSRVESETEVKPHSALDLTRLVGELSETYAARAEQAGQVFELQLPEEGVQVQGNEAQLRAVIGNLLDNAIKFTPPGGSMHLKLTQDDQEVRLSVEDSGIGIPPEDLSQLFSRFHRGRNAAHYPGSGLGLAIVKAIVQAHCGSVAVENLPEGGARFTVFLPVVTRDGMPESEISAT